MPLFHVQNNALSKPRNCPHCGQLCVNRRNKSAGSFSCYTFNRLVHPRFWGKCVPAAVTNFHHTAPTGAANFLQRVRMLLRPCSPDTAAHRAKRGRNCWGLNGREKMASWLLCQRYRNSGDRQSHSSSLCPSALEPSKAGAGASPQSALAASGKPNALRALPEGRDPSPRHYANSILVFLPERH